MSQQEPYIFTKREIGRPFTMEEIRKAAKCTFDGQRWGAYDTKLGELIFLSADQESKKKGKPIWGKPEDVIAVQYHDCFKL